MTMRIRQGDTFAWEQQLVWDDNSPIDLTDATKVDFVMCLDGEDDPVVDAPASIDMAHKTDGYVTYQFQSGDTDEVGMYKVLFRITWNDGTIMTVPNMGWMWLWIMSTPGFGSSP